MTLQVRVVHALGDQVVDLPERRRENPVIVGRADGVDVQIPSVGISRRHCALFLQDGQWVVHDTKSSAGTFVNGHRIEGPTAIGSGDHVTLGIDSPPPTLTIDPYGMLQASAPAHFSTPLPASSGTPPSPQPTARPVGLPPAPTSPYPVPTLTAHADDVPEGASSDVSAADWLTSQSASSARSRAIPYYIPKKTTWTGGMIAATIIGAVVIIGGAAYFYNKRVGDQPPPPVAVKPKPKPTPAAVVVAEPATRPSIIIPTPPPTSDDERDKRMAARQGDAAWTAIEEAHAGRLPPADAVSKYLEYLHDNPRTPYAADLRKFIDEDLDRAWWQHVDELLQNRARLSQRVSERLAELATTQDPDFRERVEKERADLNDSIASIDDQLKDLNYLSKEPPKLDNPELMKTLRDARNAEIYDGWKKRAEERIRITRGRESLW